MPNDHEHAVCGEVTHGLGPQAIEIENGDFSSVFTVLGSNAYIQQGESLIVLERSAAIELARALAGGGV